MWFLPMVGGGRQHRLASIVLVTSHQFQRLSSAAGKLSRAAPFAHGDLEMFGSFHRMRECAAIVRAR